MADILTFLRAIADKPDDEACRLVFADWLEEHGDWRAEFIRLDGRLRGMTPNQNGYTAVQARWQELRSRLSPSWLVILGRSKIENCEINFLLRCPQRWEALTATEVAAVRFCPGCQKHVYYCNTIAEARQHAEMEHCVAVDVGVPRELGDIVGLDGLSSDLFDMELSSDGIELSGDTIELGDPDWEEG